MLRAAMTQRGVRRRACAPCQPSSSRARVGVAGRLPSTDQIRIESIRTASGAQESLPGVEEPAPLRRGSI